MSEDEPEAVQETTRAQFLERQRPSSPAWTRRGDGVIGESERLDIKASSAWSSGRMEAAQGWEPPSKMK